MKSLSRREHKKGGIFYILVTETILTVLVWRVTSKGWEFFERIECRPKQELEKSVNRHVMEKNVTMTLGGRVVGSDSTTQTLPWRMGYGY